MYLSKNGCESQIPFASIFDDIPRGELIKAYGVLSSVFIYDMEALIAQLKGSLFE